MLLLTLLCSLAALVAGQDLFDTQSFIAYVNGAAANAANVRDARFAATALLDVDASGECVCVLCTVCVCVLCVFDRDNTTTTQCRKRRRFARWRSER